MDRNFAKYLLEKTRQDYNLIAEHYARTRNFVPEDIKTLAEHLMAGERILDLGCGNGWLYEPLRDKNVEYFGIDGSDKLINIARENYPEVRFLLGDAFRLPFSDNYFDKVFCLAVFHHIPSKELRMDFLKEMRRVSKPEGNLILAVWDVWRMKKTWKLFLKYSFLKIIGFSKLDFKDIFYPWRDSKRNILAQRYVHIFSKKELSCLLQKAGFKIKKAGFLKRSERGRNLYIIGQK